MSILCAFGIHRMVPHKVFYSEIMDFSTGRVSEYADHLHGHECSRCGKREIVVNKKRYSRPSPGEQQFAFDWLNAREVRPSATILKLVK